MKQNNYIKDNVSFTPADRFYDLLHELQINMLDASKLKDINSMMDIFVEIYILVGPFINKYEKELKSKTDLDNFDDVYKILNNQVNATTDAALKTNNELVLEAIKKLNIHRKALSLLMAKARLYVPTSKNTDEIPAVLEEYDH